MRATQKVFSRLVTQMVALDYPAAVSADVRALGRLAGRIEFELGQPSAVQVRVGSGGRIVRAGERAFRAGRVDGRGVPRGEAINGGKGGKL